MKYLIFSIHLKFETKINFKVHPIFLFRSVIAMQLHNLVCLFKKRKCNECSIINQCPYGIIFETMIDKNNPIIPKNEKAPHPFILHTEASEGFLAERICLGLILIGKAIAYLPYLYYAIVRAGKDGIQKERVKFDVTDIQQDGNSILEDGENIKMPERSEEFSLSSESIPIQTKKIKIELKTPFRFKKNGKYTQDFEATDFFEAIYRRIYILNSIYGEGKFPEWRENDSIRIIEKNLFWKDLKHYSARQKEELKLGGIMGSFVLEGDFSPFELSLLKGAEIFNIGKNVAFGLGRVAVREG